MRPGELQMGVCTMCRAWWFALMVGLLRPAFADGWVTGTLTYSIHHERFGHIGTHSVTVRGNQDAHMVEVTSRVSVPVLLFTFHQQVRQTEIWRGGRLVSFRRTTQGGDSDAGERLIVAAWASGDRLVVESGSGRTDIPGDVLSSHPWNPRLLAENRILVAETGELKPVKVTAHGKETVLVGGRPIQARKYVMSGGLNRDLWYDAHGLCLQVRFRKGGGDVTVTLQADDESNRIAALRSALRTLVAESPASDS